jgi:hypothetical protein
MTGAAPLVFKPGAPSLVSKGWVLGFFQPQTTAHSLRSDRLNLPLNLRRLLRPPLALQIIKILQLQPEFRIRLEIPRQPGATPLLFKGAGFDFPAAPANPTQPQCFARDEEYA